MNANLVEQKHKVGIILLVRNSEGSRLIPVFHRHARNNTGNTVNNDTWYDLVGGKRDPMPHGGGIETVEYATLRETAEEVGVTLHMDDLKVVFSSSHTNPKTPTTVSQFILAVCPKGQYPHNVDPAENGELVFLRPVEAAKVLKDRISEEVRDYLLVIK
ncbi:MAG: NUDIX hydrolase [Pseudomonadota bacterium]